MSKEIIIDRCGLGHAAVVLEEGKIIDCFIDPPLGVSFYPPNTFVKANIDRKSPNMGGYFVKLPNGIKGFLKSKNKYGEGDSVSVLSKVISEPHKPQTFTDILKAESKYFVIKMSDRGYAFSKKLPGDFNKSAASNLLQSKIQNLDDIFVICRSSAASITLHELDKEAEKAITHLKAIKAALTLKGLYYDGLARDTALEIYRTKFFNVKEEVGGFELLGIWDKLEEIKNGRVYLNTGSYLIFEQTSAFVTIDVNSGADLKTTRDEINLKACDEICRIIRIYGFGGKILIDFLTCSNVSRQKIYRKIVGFFSKDTSRNKIWGWTKSGLFELERKRDKIPLKLLM
ncbi:ribonuclease E/G [Paracoccaceae bacterium]|nr:ribonuclease E/G [Paracoccaceae bacterium]